MLITIFTATYNRAHTLKRLYNSLCLQTKFNFEWLIVDDGSDDNTELLIEDFQRKTKSFQIFYLKQNGGGKHRAVNYAAQFAHGELFFIVDSDDYLSVNACEVVEDEWRKNKENLQGLCFRRIEPKTNKIIGKEFPGKIAFPTTINFVWNLRCEKSEILRTDIVKKYPFPEFSGERFCTEAYWLYLIEKKTHLKMVCVNKGIRYTEYYADGLTRNIKEIKKKNPIGYMAYYKLLFTIPTFYLHPKIVLYTILDFLNLFFYIKKKGTYSKKS